MRPKKILSTVLIFIFSLTFLTTVVSVSELPSIDTLYYDEGYGKVYYLTKGDTIKTYVVCGKDSTKYQSTVYHVYLGNSKTFEGGNIYTLSKEFEVDKSGYYLIAAWYGNTFSVQKVDKKTSITNKITNKTTTPSSSSNYSLTLGPTNINATGNDNNNLNGEWVSIKCTSGSVNLSGWKIKDEYGWTYSFPNVTIKEGQTIKIYTGCGTNTSTSLYWCRTNAVWNNDGDTVKLIKPDGSLYGSWKVYK